MEESGVGEREHLKGFQEVRGLLPVILSDVGAGLCACPDVGNHVGANLRVCPADLCLGMTGRKSLLCIGLVFTREEDDDGGHAISV